ncbi:MAG: translocation/assembly module TamB domain-containing protein [Steroidobacteraceae bacterium]|jgi:translocation and assembly module TamB|nr:translocation/assembly module TamB domain-containing protein [Steroidobacteraceae bacterium]
MDTPKKIKPARIAAVAAAALLLALVGLAGWLVLTEAGLARIVAAVESLETVDIRIEGARGRLAGPLTVDRLQIEAGRTRIEAEGIDVDYDPYGLLFGHIRIASLGAQAVKVTIGPPEEPPRPRRSQFLPRWLGLSAGRIEVERLILADAERALLEIEGLRASGTLSHARLVLDELAADAGDFSVDGTAELTAADPLRLAGRLDFTVGRGRELAGTLEAKGDLGQLDGTATLREPLEGTVSVTLSDLASNLAWRAEAEVSKLDLARWMAEPPVGPLSGTLRGSGSLTRTFVEGHIDGAGLPAQGVDLNAHFTRDGAALDVEVLEVSATGTDTSLEARGRVSLAEPRGIEAEAAWRNLRWPIEGKVLLESRSGRLSASGWDPLGLELAARVVVPELPALDIEAQGMLSAPGLLLTQLRAAGPLGRIAGSGYFGFGPERPWQLSAQAEEFDLGQLRPGFDSRLAFSVSASGSGTGKRLAWAGALEGLAGTVRAQPASGSGVVRYQPGRIEFEQLRVDLGPARLVADGRTGRDTEIRAELRADDLSGFHPDLGGSVDARVEARKAGPREGLLIDVALRGRDLSFGEERAAVLSADALIDLSDATESWARVRAAGMTIGGQAVSNARLSLDGRARDHRFAIRVGAGEHAIDLEGSGAFTKGVYRASAARLTPAGPGVQPWGLEQPMNVLAAADRAELERTCFVYEVRKVCIAGQWRRGERWSAALDTTAFPLQALDVTLPGRPGYEGLLDVDLAVEGVGGAPWTARGVARLRDGTLTYLTPSRREERLALGVTELTLASEPGEHRLTAEVNGSELIRMSAEARIGRQPGVPLGESPIEGRLDLATRQLGLLPLLVPEIDRASGMVRTQLAFSGQAAAPEVTGFLTLEEGALDLYTVNLRMQDVSARFDFEGSSLRIDASGRVGEGRFGATGALGWQSGEPSGRLNLTGERLLVSNLPELRVEASPALDFAIDGRRLEVTGSVTVPNARIEPRQLVGAVLPSADEVIVDGEGDAEPADDYDVSTEIRLILGRAVAIDAFGLKGRLEGEVLMRTRPGEVPIASGELEIEDADYKAYSRELEVERGRLLFPGGPVADPGIDLRASKEVPGYEVGVIVRGRLRKPELTLWSDPSLPQSQIASLLVVGRTLDSLQAGDRQSLGSSADLAAQGGALLAGQIGHYVGLDEIAFEAGLDNEASVVLGKFLSPRLYIGYGISLTDSVNTFKLRYTVGDRWVVRGEAGEQQSADIEYTIDR